ncbi:MAG TPA: chemotaxis protein CheD [Nitrospirota bacterium]|nr:chemotaxis protein CheD [Nitrospirota bacterium]
MNIGTMRLPVRYLKVGEIQVTDRPSVIVTILGSCLSVTMFSRRLGVGGICHGLMPTCSYMKQCIEACKSGFKYVDCSILRMVKQFEGLGAKRSEIEVKCFGGAELFSRNNDKTREAVSIGRENIQAARKILKQEGLTLLAMDIGGNGGRKILFYPHTGEVLLKRLGKTGLPLNLR